MGALRDLAVQPIAHFILPKKPRLSPPSRRAAEEPQSRRDISKRYTELQRLRQQVKIAESRARASNGPTSGPLPPQGECGGHFVAPRPVKQTPTGP
jgi:hypothetical protein